MRPIIALTTLLITAATISAETYFEPQVFEQSLDLPALPLSEAIAKGLPILGTTDENTTEEPASLCIIEQPVPAPMLMGRLPPIRMTSEHYPQQSILPSGPTTSPIRQSLITRDFDLSGFSME